MLQQMRNTVTKMWKVAEDLEEAGIGKQIPFVSEYSDIRHTMKAEVLMIMFAIAGNTLPDDQQMTLLQYVLHAPIDNENKVEYVETINRVGVKGYHSLIPYFCIIDKLTGAELAPTYLKFIAAIALGYMKITESSDFGMIQRYFSIVNRCKELISKAGGEIEDFDPLETYEEKSKEAIICICKLDAGFGRGTDLYQAIMNSLSSDLEKTDSNEELKKLIEEKKKEIAGKEKKTEDGLREDSDADKDDDEQLTVEELLAKLDKMVGLHEVKWQVASLFNIAKISQECKRRGIKRPPMSYHMVFSGNPGTGKTTVARLMAQIYRALGLLSKGHLVEVSRVDLVGEYVGHTAVKVQSVLQKAKGGILFIDEAYSLVNPSSNDFGHEAVSALLKGMEDNREDLVVIAAGYPELMAKFLESNPGLSSRFSKTIHFPDYTAEELETIFCELCSQYNLKYSNQVLEMVRKYLKDEVDHKNRNFGNARMVRTYFESILANQANRLAGKVQLTDSMLCRITAEDIPQKFYIDKYL